MNLIFLIELHDQAIQLAGHFDPYRYF